MPRKPRRDKRSEQVHQIPAETAVLRPIESFTNLHATTPYLQYAHHATHVQGSLVMPRTSLWRWFLQNVLCLPLVLYIDHNRPSRHYPDHSQYDIHLAPLPLPSQQSRSIPLRSRLISKLRNRSPVERQQQSPLLKLPKEIRLQIYEHVVGKKILHIRPYGGRRREKSIHPRRFTCKFGEDHFAGFRWTKCSTHTDRPTQSSLSLSRCCRCVFIEATHTLYTTNIFDFENVNCLHAFLSSLPIRNFQLVRSVRLPVLIPPLRYFDCIDYGYEKPWEVLLSIPGLRELRVKICLPSYPRTIEFWIEHEGIWLAHLKRFKNLQHFEAYLPLPRTAQIPRDVDVGSCQLYAMEAYSTPYHDRDVASEASEDENLRS